MKKVAYPMRVNKRGKNVADLQAALVAIFKNPPTAECDAQRFGSGTAKIVRALQEKFCLEVTGAVDGVTAKKINELLAECGHLDEDRHESAPNDPPVRAMARVRGRITDALGRPAEAQVVVIRVGFRTEKSLAKGKTGADGGYEIALKRKKGDGLNLRIRAKFAEGTELVSPVSYDAPLDLNVDLTAAPRAMPAETLFESVEAQVRPVIGNLSLGDLREFEEQRDISFLAKDRGVDARALAKLALAHRIAAAEKIRPDVIFAFLAMGEPGALPADLLEAAPTPDAADVLEARVLTGIVTLPEKSQRRILERAVEADLVPFDTSEEIETALKTLSERQPQILAATPFGAGKRSLNDLLGLTGLKAAQKRRFAQIQLEAAKGGPLLWDRVVEDQAFSDKDAHDLRATITLGAFAKNHLPFISFAKKALPKKVLEAPGRAAAMSFDDWQCLICKGISAGEKVIPENIDGDDEGDRIGAFAQMLMERAEFNFPTMAALGRIAEHPKVKLKAQDEVLKAVMDVPDMNLRVLNIGSIRLGRDLPDEMDDPAITLRASVKAVQGLSSQAASDLMRVQRAMRMAPAAAAAATLMTTPYDAAFRVHEAGEGNFIADAVNAGMNELQARQTFGRAEAGYAYLMARFMEYRFDLDKASPDAVGGAWKSTDLIAEINNDPSLATLFGSLDSCACNWCESVHGPAAYFTDLLRWLRQRRARPGSDFADALSVLVARRPDLTDLLLNCDNTDTPMPYIDLTNEILEEAVAAAGNARQTTWRSDELMAEPEHVNEAAYTALASAQHAMGLPFDLPHTEATTYLTHLRLSRSEVMEGLRTSPAIPSDFEIAAAYFGLSQTQADIIVTAAPAQQSAFWSFASPGELIPIASCQVLMARADISYENLSDLLTTQFVNSTAPQSSFQPGFECDILERTVINLSNDRLDRMNRFVRLWRALGWAMWEVDTVLTALGGTLNATTMADMMRLERLRRRLRLDIEEAAAMVAPIDTRVRDWLTGDGQALYNDLFQNRTVLNPPDPELSIASVTAVTPPAHLESKIDTIAASLPLSADDVALLMPSVADPDIRLPVATDRASLDALSQMFRYARLARALRMRVADLLTYCRIAGAPLGAGGLVDPFQNAENLAGFVETYDRHRVSGLSTAESRHVITYWADSPLGTSEEGLERNVAELRTMLVDIRAETLVPIEERAAALDRQLPSVPGFEGPVTRATTISIINDSFAGTLTERNAFITASFAPLMPVADAIAAFAPYVGPAAGRDAAIALRLLQALTAIYRVQARIGVTSTIASQTGLDPVAANYLTWTMVSGVLASAGEQILLPAFIDRLTDDSDYVLTATRADMPDLFTAMSLIAKVSFVAEALDWSASRLVWLMENGGSYGLPDLTTLPLEIGSAALSFSEWMTLLRWVAVFDAFPETADLSMPTLLDQIGTPGYDIIQLGENLAVWTQRPTDVMAGLITAFGMSYPVQFRDVTTYERLLRAADIVKLAGVAPAQITGWATPLVTAAVAQEIKLAAKARNGRDEWLEIAPPLQDRLREAKRVALITFLTSRPAGPSWPDSNALFGHFLIDPEMTTCRKTSRLVQATGSVQLFIQRCLMNLESDVLADAETDADWRHWEWMSTYRIWEAARKVFLWPENVIRPELNTLKSPALLQLEQRLGQTILTDETAEAALESYLYEIDGIANLDVLAMQEHSVSGDRLIHVLAKTKGQPGQYYYRKRIFPNDAAAAYWSPWQKLDLVIDGSPIFGFINRKLHIFWLNFVEGSNPTQSMPPPQMSNLSAPDPQMMWEIKLVWSELRQGAWTAPHMGGKTLFYTEFRPRRSFHLKTATYSGARLAVNIFVSTSPEFNDTSLRLYNPESQVIESVEQDPSQPVHEPWMPPVHVARFVFKRDVDEVQITNRNNLFDDLQSGDYGAEAKDARELVSIVAPLTRPAFMQWVRQAIHNAPYNTSDLHVLAPSGTTNRIQADILLENAPAPFRVIPPAHRAPFNSAEPFFYADRERSFFVRPTREWRVDHSFTTEAPSSSLTTPYRVKYRFERFFHPFTGFFLDELVTGGLRQFYRRSTQLTPPGAFDFNTYLPDNLVTADHRHDVVDFGYSAAYSTYNWEAFFHVPWLIANRLTENQRFDEALKFLRFVFDPTTASSEPAPQRYWITKPFFQMSGEGYNAQRIERLLELVNSGSATHVAQVEQWRDNPFDPHLLARLRPVAYQRAIVMAYIGVLMDWGEREFRTFTMESLNLATQYFVRASELLGRRPETIPVDRRLEAKSFTEIETDLDAFGNVLAEVENLLPPPPPGGIGGDEPLPPITLFYFCIPGNGRLLDYWGRLERNLFNLRHCRDISGVERSLPLFAPPIDPAMLVRAAAAGIDFSTLAGGAAAALPHYRFRYMIQRAYAFTAEVERLGAALLRALERRDEAELAQMRETHVAEMHENMVDVIRLRIDEAKARLYQLKESKARTKTREKYWKKKKDNDMNPADEVGIVLKSVGFGLKITTSVLNALSSTTHVVPEIQVGAAGIGGTPVATTTFAGKQVYGAIDKAAKATKVLGELADKGSDLSFKIGYFMDRASKYEHEYDMANHEVEVVAREILVAEAQIAMVEAELVAEERRIAHAEEAYTFLKSRFTRKELYDWMVSEISTTYFQAYQTAFDMSLAAATCAEREVGLTASDYIGFGYWDSLQKGLLSGEKLALDLRRLEAAVIDRNHRKYEITKDVSLALLDAEALLSLRATGATEVDLTEPLFDWDFPGHYKRQIKSVAITIPTVAGPYTSVNAKLTLLQDQIRMTTSLDGGYPRTSMTDDRRFADNWAATRAIVTSKAHNDSGLFDLNLEDDRYLPFEGAGVVSRWRIELPGDTNAFDLHSVSDVVLHIRYTAEEGGETMAEAARTEASLRPVHLSAQIMRLDQVFGANWRDLVEPPAGGTDQSMTVDFTPERLPYLDRVRDLKVTSVVLVALDAVGDLTAELTAPGGVVAPVVMIPQADLGGMVAGDTQGAFAAGVPLGGFTLKLQRTASVDFQSLTEADLTGLYAIFLYKAELP